MRNGPFDLPPRPMHRDPSHGYLGGVCAGLATRLDMDPFLLRALTVIAGLCLTTPTLVAYVVLWIALPRRWHGTARFDRYTRGGV